MQNSRSSILTLLMPYFFCALFFVVTEAVASTPECSGENKASAAEPSATEPLDLTLELKNADVTKGIVLRVSFANSGPDAVSLSVCPAMLLCCVKGLHPLVTCQATGVGLLDVCKVSRPTSHEVYLPINSAFSFDLNIPPDRLPEGCIERGKKVSVCVCYEMDDTRVIRSNSVEALMK